MTGAPQASRRPGPGRSAESVDQGLEAVHHDLRQLPRGQRSSGDGGDQQSLPNRFRAVIG